VTRYSKMIFAIILFILTASSCTFKIIKKLPVNAKFLYPKNGEEHVLTSPPFIYYNYLENITIYISKSKEDLINRNQTNIITITGTTTQLDPWREDIDTYQMLYPDLNLDTGTTYYWRYETHEEDWSYMSNIRRFTTVSIGKEIEIKIDGIKFIGITSNDYIYAISDRNVYIFDENLNKSAKIELYPKNINKILYYNDDFIIVNSATAIYKETAASTPEIIWKFPEKSFEDFSILGALVLSNNTIFVVYTSYYESNSSTMVILDVDGNIIKEKSLALDPLPPNSLYIEESDDNTLLFSNDYPPDTLFIKVSKNEDLTITLIKKLSEVTYIGNMFAKTSGGELENTDEKVIYKIDPDGNLIKVSNVHFEEDLQSEDKSETLVGFFNINFNSCVKTNGKYLCAGYGYVQTQLAIWLAEVLPEKVSEFNVLYKSDLEACSQMMVLLHKTRSGQILAIAEIPPCNGSYMIFVIKE